MSQTPRYTTRFTAQAHLYTPSTEDKNQAKASLDNLKGLLPPDIVPENDIDLLYVVGNLAVANLLNANDDAVTIEDALGFYKQFERRLCDIEHDRKRLAGYILKAGLSEMGTDRLITEDEARAANVPFNIVTVSVLWKVANKDLCNFLVESATPGSPDKGALSLSFEVGFNDYDIVLLPEGVTDLSKASKIIDPEDGEYASYDKQLRINGGKGKNTKTGERIGRILSGDLLPLGQGIVTNPAAAVKGLEPILTTPTDEWSNSVEAGNGYSYSCAQLNLKTEDAKHFLLFGATIPDGHLYPPQELGDSYGPDYGRETEAHITCLYGIKTNDHRGVASVVAGFEPIKVKLGKVEAFTNPDKPYDVLKVGVHSDRLHDLHAAIRDGVAHEMSHPIYRPHLTVAYLRKGEASQYVGDTRFEGKTLSFDSLTFSPAEGNRIELPFKKVYNPETTTTMATTNRVKLPVGLAEKAKKLNYPKADITLSDGRVLKGVTVFDGEMLDLDSAMMEGVVITDINTTHPGVPEQADDGKLVHPHAGDEFPTETPEAREKNKQDAERKKLLQNMPYTDAILRHIESIARILSIINAQSSVFPNTVNKTDQSLPTMNLSDIKALEAKVKSATDPKEITEAFANVALFAEEIVKASEKHVAAADAATKAKADAEAATAALQTQLAEVKKAAEATQLTLDQIRAVQAQAEADHKFQERMAAVNEVFAFDDDVRGLLVDEIRACSDDAAFAKWMDKAKKTMKGYAKSKDSKKEKSGDPEMEGDDEPGDGGPSKEDDASKANKIAIASAFAHPSDKNDLGDTMIDLQSGDIKSAMARAFGRDISIGGRTVSEISSANK